MTIEKAREAVRNYPFDDELLEFNGTEYNAETLSKTLHYLIELDYHTIDDENKVKLGASKIGGAPHFPKSMPYPTDKPPFYAQLNFEELSKYDIEKIFPEKGMLYIFLNDKEIYDDMVDFAIYYDGDMNDLSLRDEESNRKPVVIKFKPHFIFYLNNDGEAYDYSDAARFIPDELKKKIKSILKCDITKRDFDTRIFGRPLCWQGEDMFDPEEYDEDGENLNEDGEYDVISIPRKPGLILLFQDDVAEGNMHVWIDANDLKNKDFSKCTQTYSGT
ncbi:MAG: DUF1963 domain-containing protein [Desulfobacteraceae bacterium]|nr:MAG: DUF1963 domain-containing protein [Desulfobacteraceae bacterium]